MWLTADRRRHGRTNHPVLTASIVLILVLALCHAINFWQHNRANWQRIHNATSEIREQIGGIRSLLASLAGLHQAAAGPRSAALNLFADHIREDAPHIVALGRFDRVSHEQRQLFGANAIDLGILDFRIKALDANGQERALPATAWHYPISSLEPMTPWNAHLIGVDLLSLPSLQRSLESMAAENTTVMTTFPEAWRLDGKLILVKPVFRGQILPDNEQDRDRHAAGGFWIAIDVEHLLANLAQRMSDHDIQVTLELDGTHHELFVQNGSSNGSTHLDFLYPQQQFSEHWHTDSSGLHIHFQKPVGYTSPALIITLLIAALSTLMVIALQVLRNTRFRLQADRQRSREILYAIRERAENTLNAVQDAIITVDSELQITQINPAGILLFNTRPEDTLGRSLHEISRFHMARDPEQPLDVAACLNRLPPGSTAEFEITPVANPPSDLILNLSLSSTRDQSGRVSEHVLVLRDISQEARLHQKLAYQANHDNLTGCHNRHYFEQCLATLIDQLAFDDSRHALIYLDLDRFRVVNDVCGHRAGDRLLNELVRHLKTLLRSEDLLARVGGDEFGLLLRDVTEQECDAFCARLSRLFQRFVFHHEEMAFAVHASIGVVPLDGNSGNLKDVMAAADSACFAAKDADCNSIHVHTGQEDRHQRQARELSWLPRLQTALQNDQFTLHMQPLARMQSGARKEEAQDELQIGHFEFLLRLSGDDGSEYTPGQFLRAAERYELMPQIDRWVIREAIRTISELASEHDRHYSYSINLSQQSLEDGSLADYIREQYQQYTPDPGRIWFEVTESAAASHFAVARNLFNGIRQLGSRIALDDFGSGVSSLNFIRTLPIDVIKIDGQYTRNITQNNFDRHVVEALSRFCKTQGILSVAELVDNAQTCQLLQQLDVDYIQGFHVGSPEPVRTMAARYFGYPRAA